MLNQTRNKRGLVFIFGLCARWLAWSLCTENKMKKQYNIICLLALFILSSLAAKVLAQEENLP
jgi:hypothetical protein